MKPVVFFYDVGPAVGLGHARRCMAIIASLRRCATHAASMVNPPTLPTAPAVLVYDMASPPEQPLLTQAQQCGHRLVCIDRLPAYKALDLAILPFVHTPESHLETYTACYGQRLLHGWPFVIIPDDIRRLRVKRQEIPRTLSSTILCCAGQSTETAAALRQMQELVAAWTRPLLNIRSAPWSLDALSRADIAVSLFGQTVYELLYLGIPTLVFARTTADVACSKVLEAQHSGCVVGGHVSEMERVLPHLLDQWANWRLEQGAAQTRPGFDGRGAWRIAQALLRLAQEP